MAKRKPAPRVTKRPVRIVKHAAIPGVTTRSAIDPPVAATNGAGPSLTPMGNLRAQLLALLNQQPGVTVGNIEMRRKLQGNGVGDVQNMDGDMPVPQIITFSGFSGQMGSVYRNPDEAWRDSHENARNMRNDLSVMECLEARQRAVALLPYHLETDNPDSPIEKVLTQKLTTAIELIPRFTEMRRSMQESIWYGRHGLQFNFGTKIHYGQRFNVPQKNGANEAWSPINGDKLAFRYDDGRVGIRIGYIGPDDRGTNEQKMRFIMADGRPADDVGKADYYYDGQRARKIEVTSEYGRVYFFDEDEMDRIIIHKHMIEDADYETPVQAGRVHGVGIRDRIYWTWFQKQNTLALLMEYLERSAMGFEIWTYPQGNAPYLAEIQAAAFNRLGAGKNIVFLPVIPGQEDVARMEHIETGLSGIELVDQLVHRYYEWGIKRYILGQVLSSEPESGGLSASNLSDFQKGTLYDILKYDAISAQETLTEWVNRSLKPRNRGILPIGTESIPVRVKIDTESDQMMQQLEAIETCYGMGLPIKQDSLYGLVGIDKPEPTDTVLGGAAVPMAAAGLGVPGAGPPGVLGAPGAGAPGQMNGQPPGIAQFEDQRLRRKARYQAGRTSK